MFNHLELVETTNQLKGFCVLTLLAIYEWLKIFFLYELVRHIMNIDARSGPEYPKPLYKVYFFSETSFDRALQVNYHNSNDLYLSASKNCEYYFQFWVDKYCWSKWAEGGWMSEGVGVFITYFFVWLSQGQQYETGICLALNWIGLQLESFVLKYVKPNLTETGYNTLCGTFCGLNFLLFVLFNSIAVVGLSTTQIFSVKLLQQGKMLVAADFSQSDTSELFSRILDYGDHFNGSNLLWKHNLDLGTKRWERKIRIIMSVYKDFINKCNSPKVYDQNIFSIDKCVIKYKL